MFLFLQVFKFSQPFRETVKTKKQCCFTGFQFSKFSKIVHGLHGVLGIQAPAELFHEVLSPLHLGYMLHVPSSLFANIKLDSGIVAPIFVAFLVLKS